MCWNLSIQALFNLLVLRDVLRLKRRISPLFELTITIHALYKHLTTHDIHLEMYGKRDDIHEFSIT